VELATLRERYNELLESSKQTTDLKKVFVAITKADKNKSSKEVSPQQEAEAVTNAIYVRQPNIL
jgi:hypothetical protein